MVVHSGAIQDAHGAKLLFQSLQSRPRLERLQTIWADGAYGMYGGELVQWVEENYGWKLEVVQKPPEQKGFVVIKKRWVVERTFAWLWSAPILCASKRLGLGRVFPSVSSPAGREL